MTTAYHLDDDFERQRADQWVGEFDAEGARRLFDFNRLARTLATFTVPDDLDEQMKAHCRAAVSAAKALKPGTAN
jgi:hypothetical protein